jgi:hypothetical protein
MEQVLIEVTTFLVDRARVQLEREVESSTEQSAVGELRRLHELEKELRAVRRDFGLADSPAAPSSPSGPQVSRFYEVPGQEDA